MSRGRPNFYTTKAGIDAVDKLARWRFRRRGGVPSFARIAEWANDQGLVSATGLPWTAPMVRYALVGRAERAQQRKKYQRRERIVQDEVLMPAELARAEEKLSGPLRMILILGVATGFRNSELCYLRRRHCILSAGRTTIKVVGKGRKRRSRVVSAWVAGELRQYLRHWRFDDKSEPLFISRTGRAMEKTGMGRRVKQIAQICELPDGFHAHCLRHTFASALQYYVRDINVTRIELGHRSISSTQIYLNCVYYKLKKADMQVFEKYLPEAEGSLFRV